MCPAETASSQALRDFVTSAGLPPSVLTPHVAHAPGSDKYAALAPGELAHEAGYDAFMTGSLFVHLLPLMQAQVRCATVSCMLVQVEHVQSGVQWQVSDRCV